MTANSQTAGAIRERDTMMRNPAAPRKPNVVEGRPSAIPVWIAPGRRRAQSNFWITRLGEWDKSRGVVIIKRWLIGPEQLACFASSLRVGDDSSRLTAITNVKGELPGLFA